MGGGGVGMVELCEGEVLHNSSSLGRGRYGRWPYAALID